MSYIRQENNVVLKDIPWSFYHVYELIDGRTWILSLLSRCAIKFSLLLYWCTSAISNHVEQTKNSFPNFLSCDWLDKNIFLICTKNLFYHGSEAVLFPLDTNGFIAADTAMKIIRLISSVYWTSSLSGSTEKEYCLWFSLPYLWPIV